MKHGNILVALSVVLSVITAEINYKSTSTFFQGLQL